jgi:large conductance mechanosensitive channel
MPAVVKEFRDFLLRGNLVELAVAFVMGLAFAAVVNSLIGNLVMPIIAAIVGKPDFSDLTFTIHRSVFRYGAFITDVVQFVAIAAAVFFFIVKPVLAILARRTSREAEEEAPSDEERRHQELLAAIRSFPGRA